MIRCYRDGRLVAEGRLIAGACDHQQDPASVIWIDVCCPQPGDIATVRRELDLHDLAVEDALRAGQRPKVDRYPEHLFIVAHVLSSPGSIAAVVNHEVAIFVTPRVVVTMRRDEGFDIDEVCRRWDSVPDGTGGGVAQLVHGLLDYIVDTHLDTVQRLDDEIDAIEDLVFEETTSLDLTLQQRSYAARKGVATVRRLALPMREVVNTLMRRDLGIVAGAAAPYFQDVYDHVLRVGEWTESLREQLANIMEARLTVRANRGNTIMKKVTSWAAIIAVPTAVTGFYGQNIPFPGAWQEWGVWTSGTVILVSSLVLYIVFRVKDWL